MGNTRTFLRGLKTLCFLLFGFTSLAQTIGDYRSRNNGSWNVAARWERCTSASPPGIGTWTTAGVVVPTFANGVITIRHSVNITSNITADQVVVTTGGTLVVNANVELTILNGAGTDLSIGGTGSMSVQGVLTFAAGGSLDTNNNLTILSNLTGDGQLGPFFGTITGNVIVQRYIDNNGVRAYRYLASPFTNQTVADWKISFPITGTFADPSTQAQWLSIPGIDQNSPSLYVRSEPTTAWVAYPTTNSSASLDNGRGYAAYIRQTTPIQLSFSGTPRTGNLPVVLTATGDGWNLIGNPYPSAISWDQVDITTLPVLINDAYTVLDNTNQSGVGAGNFVYYQQGVPAAAIPSGFDGTIAMGQAFWVRATAFTTLTFEETNKITSLNPFFFRKATPDYQNILRIKAEGVSNGLKDETIVCFNEDAKDGMDRKDAPKRRNSGLNLSSFADDDIEMAINTFNNAKIDREIKLDLDGASVGDYRLTFSQLESFRALPIIQLVDDFTGKTIDITSENFSYNFSVTADVLSSGSRRFRVNIKNLVTSIEDERVQVNGYPNPVSNQYTISLSKNVSFSGKVMFYNSVGQLVEPILVNSTQSQNVFDFSNFPSGVFIVKIPTASGVHLLKAIKK